MERGNGVLKVYEVGRRLDSRDRHDMGCDNSNQMGVAVKLPAKVITTAIAAASAVAIPFIAGWEGKRNDPYSDIVGVKTVCYGETRVTMRRYTDAECLQMLNRAVTEDYMKPVLECTPILGYYPYALAMASSLVRASAL